MEVSGVSMASGERVVIRERSKEVTKHAIMSLKIDKSRLGVIGVVWQGGGPGMVMFFA